MQRRSFIRYEGTLPMTPTATLLQREGAQRLFDSLLMLQGGLLTQADSLEDISNASWLPGDA